MGFFDKLIGGGAQHPALSDTSPAAQQLDALKETLEELTRKVNDPLEVVVAGSGAYVFIGKPPTNFGLAWIEDGQLHNFKTLAEDKGIPQKQLLRLVDELAAVYQQHEGANRYSATVGGRSVTVTPSADLAAAVQSSIANT
jgi:hypothetical protein